MRIDITIIDIYIYVQVPRFPVYRIAFKSLSK